ncbi:MAG TPA: hypothetical protein VMT89_00100 [Candidatus Acidoferrales bacterium]|nr:hypothetical protein [Candidatus Acidoferrales bacterium]
MSHIGFSDIEIVNVALTNGVEAQYTLPRSAMVVEIQCRTAQEIKVAFTVGRTADQFRTIKIAPAKPLVLRLLGDRARDLFLLAGADCVAEITIFS